MKQKIAITIDEEILEGLKVLSRKEDRNISNLINKIVKIYLEEKVK